MRASETNSGHRAVGLDTLIAPIKRELSGAQGNLLEVLKRAQELKFNCLSLMSFKGTPC